MNGEGVKEIASLVRDARIIEITEPSIREQPIPVVVLPGDDGGFQIIGIKELLEPYRTAPERRTGTAQALTLESFIALVNRHKDVGSAVFADTLSATPSLLAIIDYHDLANDPRYGRHKIAYAFPVSPEWKAWKAANANTMTQSAFAAFIEEHVADLASPDALETNQAESLFLTTIAPPSFVVTLSKGLAITVDARVKEFVNLSSGEVEVGFEEVHKDGSGKKLKVPGMFVVNIPLFVGAEPSRLLARLRYRKADDKIVWWFQLYRAEEAVRQRLKDDLLTVATETALPTFEGSPEK